MNYNLGDLGLWVVVAFMVLLVLVEVTQTARAFREVRERFDGMQKELDGKMGRVNDMLVDAAGYAEETRNIAYQAKSKALEIGGQKVGMEEFGHLEERVSRLDGMPRYTQVAPDKRKEVFAKLYKDGETHCV